MLQALWGFLAAAFGWIILEFRGRPSRKFFDLRGETVELLTRIANVPADYFEGGAEPAHLNEVQLDALAEAQEAVRELASKFRAFALNETWASKAAGLLGYDPYAAGQGLAGLSNAIETYGKDRSEHRRRSVVRLKSDHSISEPSRVHLSSSG